MWWFVPKTQFSFGPKNCYGSHAIVNGLLGCKLIILLLHNYEIENVLIH